MQPYIQSVDRSTPIGALVHDYGAYQFKKGLVIGFLSGITVSIVVSILFRKIRKN